MTRGLLDVWAPRAERVQVLVDGDGGGVVEMRRADGGWWTPEGALPGLVREWVDLDPDARDATDVDYGYMLDDDPEPRPDPRSRRQPRGVHQLSRLYDPRGFRWSDQAWTGRTQQELLSSPLPSRSQWNLTFTRPNSSVKISSPAGPTTIAVCGPSTMGFRVVRAVRKGRSAATAPNATR